MRVAVGMQIGMRGRFSLWVWSKTRLVFAEWNQGGFKLKGERVEGVHKREMVEVTCHHRERPSPRDRRNCGVTGRARGPEALSAGGKHLGSVLAPGLGFRRTER